MNAVHWVLGGLIVVGMVPLTRAWQANRRTSLAHALLWTIAAWLSWGVAFVVGDPDAGGIDAGRYCALCLTGCAGVAVLGARRPHVAAWNFVVLGLFAVMILPLAESIVLGTAPVDGLRIFFLSATIAVGILNYAPTRLGPAAMLLLPTCAGEIVLLYRPDWLPGHGTANALDGSLTLTPWIAWLCLRRRSDESLAFNTVWWSFRDRWGLLWSQRVREQFNHAAQHAGWPARLAWRGLKVPADQTAPTPSELAKMKQTLHAVLQRFTENDPGEGAG